MSDRPYPLLDLFSGYGGFSLAFEAVMGDPQSGGCGVGGTPGQPWSGRHPDSASAFRTIGFSEIEPYACALLAHRFPGVPNLGPVQSVTRDRVLRECGVLPVVVTGGFPCQPHSTAGKRLAGADDRDLWAECVRVLREFRPRVALFENVPGLLTSKSPAPDGRDGKGLFFNRVLSDLAEIGFACQWETLSAAQVGAPHKRDRLWLLCVDELADQPGGGRGECWDAGEPGRGGHADGEGAGGVLPDTQCERGQISPAWGHAGEQLPRSDGEDGQTVWPAAHGRWPARPGEAQYEWEPSRVVLADTGGQHGERGSARVGRRDGSAIHANARADGRVQGWEAEPLLGRDADGPADRLDAAPAEVREAPSDQVNRTQRLKALGNGIVPACAYPFAVAIRDYLDGTP